MEDLLIAPEQVDGGDDHAGCSGNGPPAMGDERADQDEELSDESIEPGNADRGQHGQGEHTGQDGRRGLQPLERTDLPRVAAFVDPAHQDEQGGDDQTVIDHLDDAAGESLAVEGERPEGDESDLGQRRIGEETLQVALGAGDKGAIGDADHGQRQQDRRQGPARLRKEVEVEPDDPVGAELGHDRHEQDGPGGRSLGVGVRGPGVEGEDRRLDGKRCSKGDEEQDAFGARQVRVHQRRQLKGEHAGLRLVDEGDGHDADQ